MSIDEQRYSNRGAMFGDLARSAEQLLRESLANAGRASLAVSGGRTPEPLYRSLAQAKLAWERIDVALVDERWVPVDHPASNAALIRRSLIQARAAAANFIGMKNSAPSASLGQALCNEAYSSLKLPFDLTLLGMGDDGHTASLFPHAEGLSAALDPENSALCAPIIAQPSAVTGENIERMTLTLSALLQSRQIWLLLTGETKWEIYQRATQATDILGLPVSAVLNQELCPVKVFWAP